MKLLTYMKHFKLRRVSTGLTVFAAAGFLVSAILTDNGGSTDYQSSWLNTKTHTADEVWIDPVSTGSIRKVPTITIDRNYSAKEPSVLSIIQENTVPDSTTGDGRVSITVQPGDTLFGIGKRHGLPMSELARLNGLEAPYTIRVGQTLYIAR